MPLKLCAEMPRKKNVDSEFGKRLVAIRQARGLTQIQLAAAAGITQRAVSYYETGGYPAPPILVTLAEVLEISTDELLGIRPHKLEHDFTPATKRLWKQFQKIVDLPERDHKAVLRLVNSLASTAAAQKTSRRSAG